MNKKDIINKLSNTHLDEYDRESLCQLLHYMNVEGINNTSSNNNTNNSHKRSSTSTSSNRKGNKHTSSNNKHTR